MTDIVTNIATKVGGYLVPVIGRQLRYLFCYRSYMDDLDNEFQELQSVRDGLLITVGDEMKRAGYEIRPIVQEWLNQVDAITKEVVELMRDENNGCFNGWCPNFKSRYLLGRKAEEKAQEIVQIIEKRNFPDGVCRPVPLQNLTLRNFETFGSRASILNQIMDALGDDKIKMVGVWGMGGVGKTTLVKQVVEQAKQGKLFTTEVYIDVSWTQDLEKPEQAIAKIQQEIADMLHLKFEGKNESTRAIELNHRLKKEKILIVLDDIWKEIDLEKVGIPCKDDLTECKVVLTSRNLDLIRQYMDDKTCFLIQQLPRKEAWSLFNKTSGGSLEKNLELLPIASDVVDECEGLPIAIVTIAKALKGKKVAVWRNALKELRTSAPTIIQGVGKKAYSCLELSYNHLENDEVKSLFLLCGLLGDGDISLDDLLKYGMGLDLFDYMDSLEQARDKIVTLVEILQNSSLLLDSLEDVHYRKPSSLFSVSSLFFVEEGNAFVRMHDMVRDVAKAIASKDPHHQFVVNKDVTLQEWVKWDGELRNCTRLSLKCTQVHELPELVCPKLKIFLFNNYNNSLKIPDTFFKEMKEVRVLSLSGIDLTQLLSSLHFLSNLRTLCLHLCGMLKDISILGGLKKLQILSLEGCQIQELPQEMMQLTDLRMLSLSGFSILVRREVISSLSRLEHLCVIIHTSGGGWDNNWLYELKHLSCLRALELRIAAPDLLPKYVSFENLTRYAIFIGHKALCHDDKGDLRRLTLQGIKGPRLVRCFSRLLKTVEVLELRELDDTKHFVYELDNDGFRQLRHLLICGGSKMQYIMNTIEMEGVDPPHSAFPLLEELRLRWLGLEAVCHGPIPIGCFANLRILKIKSCFRLKYILWLPTAQGMESVLVFPQLRFLKLTSLPNLIDFYSIGSSRSQEPFIPLFNQKVALPGLEELRLDSMENVITIWDNQHPVGFSSKLKDLYLFGCDNLLTVFPSNFLKGLQSLQILEIEDCCSLKEIFEVGEINREKSDGITIPQLKEMSSHGQNTKSVKKDPQGYLAFQNLNSLKVGKCASLRYIFPASVAKGLVQLEVLEISGCGVEEIVANENGLEAAPIFLFPRLTSLKLIDLHQLKRFYRGMYTLRCQFLKELVVRNCDEVELLLQEKSLQGEVDKQPLFLVEKDTFPNVEELQLGFKGPMEIWWGQFSRESFGKLRVLEIEACHDISVVIPSSKLQALHNIEQLIVRSCNSVEKVIQVEGHAGETLPRLTIMYLKDLPMLRHLSGLGPILQNLQSLQVSQCGNLINLVSPSMAKRLVQLKELTVDSCDEVKEIVENEGGEATDDEILFTKLQKLELSSLPNLKSFCSARYTFKFPCLIEMQVIKCPKMEFFCKGDSITERLQRVKMGRYHQCWENDLNTTIQKMFMETNAELMEEDVEEYGDFKELDPKEEDSEDEVPDEEDDEEGDSEEQHPNVEDSVEEDTEEEDSEGRSGSLGPRSW